MNTIFQSVKENRSILSFQSISITDL